MKRTAIKRTAFKGRQRINAGDSFQRPALKRKASDTSKGLKRSRGAGSVQVGRVCEECGKEFSTAQRYIDRGVGRFCSYLCVGTSRQKRVTRSCGNCGISFSVPQCRSSSTACSGACSRILRRTAKTQTCKTCGKTFQIKPSQFKYYKGAGQYCSKKCGGKGAIAKFAEMPIADKYGRSRRHADRLWQKAVRERDDYTCQRCGVRDPYIHAHHVATRARRPDLKHDVSNGKCLCNSCHTFVHHHPIEATAMGLLSDETYEAAMKAA